MSNNRLVFGINHEEFMPSAFVQGLTDTCSYGPNCIWVRGYAGRLDLGRNEVMRHFLEERDEAYLFMLDTDHVFRPSDVADIMSKADPETNPITGGLYINEGQRPVALVWKDGESRHWDGKGRGLVKVDILGFGFTAIHRSVVQAVWEETDGMPCDNARTGPKGQALSDDFSFMYTCTQLGYQPKLNTDVKVGHVKSAILFPEGYE